MSKFRMCEMIKSKKGQVAETFSWFFFVIFVIFIMFLFVLASTFIEPPEVKIQEDYLSGRSLAELCLSICFKEKYYEYCCETRKTVHTTPPLEEEYGGMVGAVDVTCNDELNYQRLNKYCELNCEKFDCKNRRFRVASEVR